MNSNLDIFNIADSLNFGDIHFKSDPESGLHAIIAIHNTNLGPALGGCRFVPYPSTDAALLDVLNLSHAMSYKAALAGLPLGGGKAVIIKNSDHLDREKIFSAYGRFVDELGGRYISSVDSGTSPTDMDIACQYSKYIRSTSKHGDPSPFTATGVRRGIEAAVKHKLNRNSLSGIHVAIQGAGHVGYYLARELYNAGAVLTICDRNQQLVKRCADEFSANVVAPDEIYDVHADVFAPCALGGVINENTISRLKVKIVAGAANNALASSIQGHQLFEKGILYAPDYVINAGGLMQVWEQDQEKLLEKVLGIYETLITIFDNSQQSEKSPETVANEMAEEIIYKKQGSA